MYMGCSQVYRDTWIITECLHQHGFAKCQLVFVFCSHGSNRDASCFVHCFLFCPVFFLCLLQNLRRWLAQQLPSTSCLRTRKHLSPAHACSDTVKTKSFMPTVSGLSPLLKAEKYVDWFSVWNILWCIVPKVKQSVTSKIEHLLLGSRPIIEKKNLWLLQNYAGLIWVRLILVQVPLVHMVHYTDCITYWVHFQ